MKNKIILFALLLTTSQTFCSGNFFQNSDPKQYGIVALGLGIFSLGLYSCKQSMDSLVAAEGSLASKILVRPVKVITLGLIGVGCMVTGGGVVFASQELGDAAAKFIASLQK